MKKVQMRHNDSTYLAHHFESLKQQYESAKLGMWLFLITEVLLFGGLFVAYSVYRANHPEIFVYGHKFLDVNLGAINTVILICSSLTIALAVRCAQLGQRKALVVFLALTILGGIGFLGIKYIEYEHKWKHGLLWGKYYREQVVSVEKHSGVGEAGQATGVDLSPYVDVEDSARGKSDLAPGALEAKDGASHAPAIATGDRHQSRPSIASEPTSSDGVPQNVQIFFAVYFAMTGLHGLHVLAGIVVIAIILILAIRGRFNEHNFTAVDLTGLYWHLVDLIWIYLFPLFYLIH